MVSTAAPVEAVAGKKFDNQKPISGVLGDFSRALNAVAEVGTFGAKKYDRGNWLHVEHGQQRYTDAMWRHLLAENIDEFDDETQMLHAAHLAWNALARLELYLIEKENVHNNSKD